MWILLPSDKARLPSAYILYATGNSFIFIVYKSLILSMHAMKSESWFFHISQVNRTLLLSIKSQIKIVSYYSSLTCVEARDWLSLLTQLQSCL